MEKSSLLENLVINFPTLSRQTKNFSKKTLLGQTENWLKRFTMEKNLFPNRVLVDALQEERLGSQCKMQDVN